MEYTSSNKSLENTISVHTFVANRPEYFRSKHGFNNSNIFIFKDQPKKDEHYILFHTRNSGDWFDPCKYLAKLNHNENINIRESLEIKLEMKLIDGVLTLFEGYFSDYDKNSSKHKELIDITAEMLKKEFIQGYDKTRNNPIRNYGVTDINYNNIERKK